MKNFKKIASAIAALSLAACMVAPVATMTSFAADGKGSITITNPSTVSHTYEAYQIFKGTLSTDGVLTEIAWGSGVDISAESTILSELKAITIDGVKPFEVAGVTDAKSVAKVLSEAVDTFKKVEENADKEAKDLEIAKEFAKVIGKHLSKEKKDFTKGSDNNYTATGLADGYWLVKDKDDTAAITDDAYTRYILKVAGTATGVTVKSAQPTVDKQVWDHANGEKTDDALDSNDKGNTGWGETADHEIGETFQFKLIATLPEGTELDEYDKYALQFNDSWDAGITYVGNITLKVGNNTITITPDESGTTNATGTDKTHGLTWAVDDTTEHKLTFKIDDVKSLLGAGVTSLSGIKVEVVYDAKLNDKANVANANAAADNTGKYEDGTAVNDNSVDLWYSHNPNSTGGGNFDTDHGKTTPDTVGVFTYEVDSTKVDGGSLVEGEYAKKLGGAKFRLYYTTTEGDEDPVTKKHYATFTNDSSGNYTFAGWVDSIPVADSDTSLLTSVDNTGIFNIKGLDAGVYELEEVEAPVGYNALKDPVEIKIVAAHSENTEGSGATLELKNSKYGNGKEIGSTEDDAPTTLSGVIENQKGASLPSTGGIGTTLFYLGGGALVAVAGVMLITKKRMTKE